MKIVDFNGEDYALLFVWFDLAFAKKQNQTSKDVVLHDKIKVMARQWLEDNKEE